MQYDLEDDEQIDNKTNVLDIASDSKPQNNIPKEET